MNTPHPEREGAPLLRAKVGRLGWLEKWRAARRARRPLDLTLDEHGIPRAWRRSEPMNLWRGEFEPYWQMFQDWCDASGVRGLPASPETLDAFLRSGSISGPDLARVYTAIELRHDSEYWHEDANPVHVLQGRGVRVDEGGTVTRERVGEES